MEFTAILLSSDSPLWGHHIMVPDAVCRPFLDQGQKRVVCTLNGSEVFQCALMPHGDGQYFININKQLRDKLRIGTGAQITVSLKKDDSQYGLPMPDELAELLRQDSEGDDWFHALTPGKQRTLLYIAGKPKQSETRLKKSLVLIEHLKANKGKIDFKRLNEDLKAANHF